MKKLESARLRLFPLNAVLFPGATLNVHVFEPRYKRMISECLELKEAFGVALIAEGEEASDPDVVPYKIGTSAEISEMTPLGGGRFYVSTTGKRRFHIDEVTDREPYLQANVTYLDEDAARDPQALSQLVDEIRNVFGEYLRLLADFSGVHGEIRLPGDPIDASFTIADTLQVADAMKQRLLEISDTEKRLMIEAEFLRRLLPQLRAVLERRKDLPALRGDAPLRKTIRSDQERFFGKYFSLN
jgi:Lon protease-like protein